MKALRAIVTAGATNLGLGISEALLQRGAIVAVSYHSTSGPALALQQRYGERVIALSADLGYPEQCRAFVDEAARQLGGLDVLVNNAAVTGSRALATIADLQVDQFDEVLRVNLGSVVFCSQAALPHLRRAGGGVIVHISSINAFRPQAAAHVYAATKAGVCSLARSMAKEFASDKIRVVSIAPGAIRTGDTDQVVRQMEAKGLRAEVGDATPLGRGKPSDIGALVNFLVSDDAKFVSGVTWVVDGGYLA